MFTTSTRITALRRAYRLGAGRRVVGDDFLRFLMGFSMFFEVISADSGSKTS